MKTCTNPPPATCGQTIAGTRITAGPLARGLALALALAFAPLPVTPAITAAAEDAAESAAEGGEPAPGPIAGIDDRSALEQALAQLELPGVTINVDERSIDLDSIVVLREGTLELIACRVGTKEHESIVAVKARPMHIHTALLLLGATAGNPSMWQRIGEEDAEPRWMHVPPRGGRVDVSLVIEDDNGQPVERPISDFVSPRGLRYGEIDEEDAEPFPTNSFLFTGSQLQTDNDGRRRYLGDISGNVITVVSFGDEVLGLSQAESATNTALMWEVDPTHLPALDSEVVLRLRPRADEEAVEGAVGETLQDATQPPSQPGGPAPAEF